MRMLKLAGLALLATLSISSQAPQASAQMANYTNTSRAWGGAFANPRFDEQYLRRQEAILQFQLERYGIDVLAPAGGTGGGGSGAGGGGMTVNGTVNYNGPVTNSGSSVLNIGTLSTIDISGSGNPTIGLNQGQQGPQTGTATSAASQTGPANAASNR